MQTLLIADRSVAFADGLEAAFRDQYRILRATDGISALQILQSEQPDIAIINLMLPHKDGLTVLQQSSFHPHIIIAITNYMSGYVQRTVAELGIDYTLIMPSVETVVMRLRSLIQSYTAQDGEMHAVLLHHLHLLKIPSHLAGYRQLCVAIPLYSANPNQLMTKELYPEVARQCSCRDGRLVEHSIRKAITTAWKYRDVSVWRKYFPPRTRCGQTCPSNKVFICTLAELLNEP